MKVVTKPRANVINEEDNAEDSDGHQPLAISRASPAKPGRHQESEVRSDSEDDTPLAVNIPVKSRKGKEVIRRQKEVVVAADTVRRLHLQVFLRSINIFQRLSLTALRF